MEEHPNDVFSIMTRRMHQYLGEIEEDYRIHKDEEKEDYRPEII